eukprot:TRINITY_DN6364_c0_g4_i1.p2 TRINITY_DN6364_c0_g4~~TRINITY_DN6364_c0_g4_i1.p2  ORF type:complete len:115 (-),score=3.20 TRINITY_DN6364_c0_g4_i1:341-685(-)
MSSLRCLRSQASPQYDGMKVMNEMRWVPVPPQEGKTGEQLKVLRLRRQKRLSLQLWMRRDNAKPANLTLWFQSLKTLALSQSQPQSDSEQLERHLHTLQELVWRPLQPRLWVSL